MGSDWTSGWRLYDTEDNNNANFWEPAKVQAKPISKQTWERIMFSTIVQRPLLRPAMVCNGRKVTTVLDATTVAALLVFLVEKFTGMMKTTTTVMTWSALYRTEYMLLTL